jgi:hypothetical protein
MEFILMISFTHIFASLLGFVIYKSRENLDEHTRSILSKLSQLHSKTLELFSLEGARAAKATKILSEVKVKLLDR